MSEPANALDDKPRCIWCGWYGDANVPLRHLRHTAFHAPFGYECTERRSCEKRERENEAAKTGGYTGDPASDYGLG